MSAIYALMQLSAHFLPAAEH